MAEWTANHFYNFMYDPVFMHYAIFNRLLPPHQRLMIESRGQKRNFLELLYFY